MAKSKKAETETKIADSMIDDIGDAEVKAITNWEKEAAVAGKAMVEAKAMLAVAEKIQVEPRQEITLTATQKLRDGCSWARISSMKEAIEVADLLARSGVYKDARNTGVILAKAMLGASLGIGFMNSQQSIYAFEGKLTVGYQALLNVIRDSGKYDYEFAVPPTREQCKMNLYRVDSGKRILIATESMTLREAMEAGFALDRGGKNLKDNWKYHSDDMLIARVTGKICKRYCIELFNGSVPYTQDEVEEIESRPAIVMPSMQPALPAPKQAPEQIEAQVVEEAEKNCTVAQLNKIESLFKALNATPEQEVKVMDHYKVKAISDLDEATADRLISFLTGKLATAGAASGNGKTANVG